MIRIWYWIWGSVKSYVGPQICEKVMLSPITAEILDDSIISAEVVLLSPITTEMSFEGDLCW